MKRYKEIFETNAKRVTGRDVSKVLKNKSDFGDLGDSVRVIGKNVEIVDTFWAGSDKALTSLKRNWVGDGPYAKYFADKHNVKFKIVKDFVELNPKGYYKKFGGNNLGVVGIHLEVIPI